MKNLVIVESPSKSHTIEKYLGGDYKVVASLGHVRDLATTGKFGLGIDVDNDFKPSYIAMKGKNKVIKELKDLVSKSDKVYLATAPTFLITPIAVLIRTKISISSEQFLT